MLSARFGTLPQIGSGWGWVTAMSDWVDMWVGDAAGPEVLGQ